MKLWMAVVGLVFLSVWVSLTVISQHTDWEPSSEIAARTEPAAPTGAGDLAEVGPYQPARVDLVCVEGRLLAVVRTAGSVTPTGITSVGGC